MERATDFWNRVDLLISKDYKSVVEFCAKNRISVGTFYGGRARNRYPRVELLVLLAKSLDTSADYLLFGTEKQSNLSDEKRILERYNSKSYQIRMAIDRLLEVGNND